MINGYTLKIIIFDYDDTIYPTTYINSMYSSTTNVDTIILSDEVKQSLINIEKITLELFNKAYRSDYKIWIVTNASYEWVFKSMYLHLPKLFELSKKLNVNIISSRNKYYKLFPNNPTLWKYYTFNDIIYKYINNFNISKPEENKENEMLLPVFTTVINNCLKCICKKELKNIEIISVGDSDYEKYAIYEMRKNKYIINLITKIIKLISTPDTYQIIKQLKLIENFFESITKLTYNTDIELSIKEQINIIID